MAENGEPDGKSKLIKELEVAGQLESIKTQLTTAVEKRKRAREFLAIRKDILTRLEEKFAANPNITKGEVVLDIGAWATTEEEMHKNNSKATEIFEKLTASYPEEDLDEDVPENDTDQEGLDTLSNEFQDLTLLVFQETQEMEPQVQRLRVLIDKLRQS